MNSKTVELLQKHFDAALETPDGIKKLRGLILTLAMQGKLVKQDPNDQPASELLKEIEAEKKRLLKEGKIRKQEPFPPIKKDEIPYELPRGWEWVMLGEISARIHYGFTASANASLKNIRLLRITDIQDNKVNWESVPGCTITEKEANQYKLNNNDILIARTGGTIGKSYLVENLRFEAVFASYLIRVVPPTNIYVRYLKLCIESPLYWRQLYAKCSGTGQPNVNGTSLSTLLLSLPPLAEQHRIVAKIDQLMALCDTLESLRVERNQKRLTVHTAAINALLKAQDKTAFDTSWQFITSHFNELYSVPENVAELRKTILQLAVMGKLVPQNPNDQPASELLKEIEAEKNRLEKEGKIKKQEPLPPVKAEEMLFELPKDWKWLRLGDISSVNMGQSPDGKSYNDEGRGVPLVNGPVEFGGKGPFDKTVASKFTTSPTKMCHKGDLLLCVRGSTTGRTNIAGFVSCIGRGVAALRSFIFNSYFNYFILSSRKILFDSGTGSTFPNISYDKIISLPFPLPPLAEQRRIVAKIDQLMTLCDELEIMIASATDKQTTILNAVLSQG
ncbi:MAG: restriction endonuclease subunit S [Candidatus Riflebacteria bacterium]|nr:restriction endonuclease subunit S [Candidatus Riflebacteria bacterium]